MRRWLGVAAVGAVAIALVAAVQAWPARVTGATPAERIACICRLADRHPRGAADAIATAAAHDPDASVRRAAVLCLGKFRRPADRPLIENCTRDADPSVREMAAMALARYADPGVTDRLAEMAMGDAAETVRVAALTALDLKGGPAALVALVEAMEKSQSIQAKQRAGELLVRKFGIIVKPEPENPPAWNNLLEMVKGLPSVQAAYRQADKPLARHPEHRLPVAKEH